MKSILKRFIFPILNTILSEYISQNDKIKITFHLATMLYYKRTKNYGNLTKKWCSVQNKYPLFIIYKASLEKIVESRIKREN